MTTTDLKKQMYLTWMKLLKASVRNKQKKIAKLESKLIQFELEAKQK